MIPRTALSFNPPQQLLKVFCGHLLKFDLLLLGLLLWQIVRKCQGSYAYSITRKDSNQVG